MFICRHILRRANTPQTRLTARHVASLALLVDARSRVGYVRLPPTLRMLSDGPRKKDVPSTRRKGDDPRGTARAELPASLSASDPDPPARKTENRDKVPAIAAYFSVRETYRKATANLPPEVLLDALDAIKDVDCDTPPTPQVPRAVMPYDTDALFIP